MTIEYSIKKYIKETMSIDIVDTKNVFLKGKNIYDNTTTYFGIWDNGEEIVIAILVKNRYIYYTTSKIKSVFTEEDIKEYLSENKNVTVISREEFKENLDRIKSRLVL